MEQEAAERLKAQEPWRITDNELELYKAKVRSTLNHHTAIVRAASQPKCHANIERVCFVRLSDQPSDQTERAAEGTLKLSQTHRHVRAVIRFMTVDVKKEAGFYSLLYAQTYYHAILD